MADLASSTGDKSGVAFLVSAGIMYEIIAAACSSPQTTELNARARSETLMKWVTIGVATGAGFVGYAAWIDPAHRREILSGGLVAGAIMTAYYVHAKHAGLASSEPPTEVYPAPQPQGY